MSVKYDGKKEIVYTWSLTSSNATDTIELRTILENMTTNNLNFLEIPSNTLESYSNYNISISYRNFMNIANEDYILLNTTSNSGIVIELEN